MTTSPYRIKSPVPVCCGFDSLKLACRAVARDVHDTGGFHLGYGVVVFGGSWVTSEGWWAREDLHLQGSQTLDLRGLLFPLNHSPKKLEPPPGMDFPSPASQAPIRDIRFANCSAPS